MSKMHIIITWVELVTFIQLVLPGNQRENYQNNNVRIAEVQEKTYTLRDRLIPVERLRIHSHKLFFVVSRTFITSVIALYQKEVHGIAT